MNARAPSIRNAMTVDVEDYFQVSAFEKYIPKEKWAGIEGRVERNVNCILDLFEQKAVQATFFMLGCVATRCPAMVRRITDSGHELASHGWEHIRVSTQNPGEFKDDIVRTRGFLEDISGQAVRGYRAASYSIGANNLWAWDILAEAGYQYSSSIVPIKHDLYGMPGAPRFAFRTANEQLLEIPITTIPVLTRNINCGGGGWFRFFPYEFTHWALKRVNESDKQPCIFYTHPWEIDVEQPRISNLSMKTKFRHYVNLDKTLPRLNRLLDDFSWGRMDNIFLGKTGLEAPEPNFI